MPLLSTPKKSRRTECRETLAIARVMPVRLAVSRIRVSFTAIARLSAPFRIPESVATAETRYRSLGVPDLLSKGAV